MKRLFSCLTALFVAMFLFAGVHAEAAVDWGSKVITVTGSGVANPALVRVPAQAVAMAKRAAIAE